MPIYEFETDAGTIIEEFYPMKDAPVADGNWVKVKGQKCKRIISRHEPRVIDNAHVSSSLPRKGTGIEKVWDKFTPEGKPYFESNKDVAEFQSRSTYRRE